MPTNAPTGSAQDAEGRDPLEGIAVAVPCTVPWETMRGDARSRSCGTCGLRVHDLSQMSRADALAFVAEGTARGAACVRIHRRPDGRVLTADCRRAVRALRRRAMIAAATVLGALGLGGAACVTSRSTDFDDPATWESEPYRTLSKILPDAWIPQRRMIVVGRLIMPPPLPAPAAPTGSTTPADPDDR